MSRLQTSFFELSRALRQAAEAEAAAKRAAKSAKEAAIRTKQQNAQLKVKAQLYMAPQACSNYHLFMDQRRSNPTLIYLGKWQKGVGIYG
jgi:hypothetical protein